jgi:hypothetical protein
MTKQALIRKNFESGTTVAFRVGVKLAAEDS